MVFATVRYGKDKFILINPQCAVINLLDDMRKRCNQRHGIQLDLTDQTGLVIDLNAHKTDHAEKFLNTRETYVLVEKQVPEEDLLALEFGSSTGDLALARTPSPAQSTRSARSLQEKAKYTVLLDNIHELLPDYRLRLQRGNEKKKDTSSRPMSRASDDDPIGSGRAKSRGRSMKSVANAISARKRLKALAH